MDRLVLSSGLTLTHMFALVLILGWGLWPLRRDLASAACAFFLLVWTDFVCTALLLATVSKLGDRLAYVGVSLDVAVALAAMIRRSLPSPSSALASPVARRLDHDLLFEQGARLLCGAVIVIAVVASASLCIAYDPNNYDSLAYRLPRAILYIGQGTLAHIRFSDYRVLYYPFDMTLAYVATAIHGLSARWMNLFGFVAWIIGGVAVERTARECGAGKSASLLAATLFLTSPAVLVSASSGNDDLMSGVPLVIGLLFVLRWWRSTNSADAAFAAMGLGLSLGSKLHVPFLLPVAALFCALLVYRLGRSGRLRSGLHDRARQIVFGTGIVALLAVPAIAINIKETGHATPVMANFQNSPFSPLVAGVNTVLFSANLFLSPIPDLDLNPSTARRKAVYDRFNHWFNRHLFAWVSPALDYSNEPNYRFEGVASSDAYEGVWEQSAWVGFVPLLLLTVLIFARRGSLLMSNISTDPLRFAAFWLSAVFFGWHLARGVTLKYVGGAGIYYAFIMAVAAPGLAWLWDAGDVGWRRRGFFRIACLAVLGANLVSAANEFSFNYQRNIPDILRAENFDPRPSNVDPELRTNLKSSPHTLIAYTQWELPLFDLMAVNPKARYALTDALTAAPVPGFDLDLMLQRTRTEFGDITVQFAHDDRDRLSLLGTVMSAYGDQRSFGHDVQVPDRAPDVVATYQAGGEEGSIDFVRGWSASETTHRWSAGRQSALAFTLPAAAVACRLNLKALTAGPQTISLEANGDPAGSVSLDGWFPGVSASVPLPDAAMIPGQRNTVTLSYDHPHDSPTDRRELALALIEATVTCRRSLSDVVDRNWRGIFSYSAAKDAEDVDFGGGWSPSERTHRWSDGPESEVSFILPRDSRACDFRGLGITAGPETIAIMLNGHRLQPIHLQAWFPGAPFEIALPDDLIRTGDRNTLVFRYDRTEAVDGRKLALGLIRASLLCRRTGEATGDDLQPLNPHGFVVLGIDEHRDATNGLQAVTLSRLNGVASDESFVASVSLLSRSGEVVFSSAKRASAIGQMFELPGAPHDGYLKVTLTRVDRSDIEAEAYVPISFGSTLPLDLRRRPGGS